MSEPRIVTSEEAQEIVNERGFGVDFTDVLALAHTVATEPGRIRAAVVQALRDAAQRVGWFGQPDAALQLTNDADAIEGGSDF